MDHPHHETAQICLNGHVVNARCESYPETQSSHCVDCGQPTTKICPACQAKIRGIFVMPKVLVKGQTYALPSFCHACGAAYPWTDRKKEALIEAIDLLELPSEDRAKLKDSIPDVMRDTPKTQTAATRFGQAISKTGEFGRKVLGDVLTKVATEGALILAGLKPPI